MAVEVKTISLADMASKTHWPPAEDVVTGIHAMKAIAQMQAPLTLTPREAEAMAICIGAVGLAVGRVKARTEINAILEHRN